VRFALPLLVLLGACSAGPPAPDAGLGASARAPIDAVEIGAAGEGEFAPLADGAPVQAVRGPQGGDMIPLRLRVLGLEPPECVQQTTTVTQGQVTGMLATPLATYADAPGTRATRTAYVILSGPPAAGPATVAVDCAGKQTTVGITVVP
jgi:hypothetical protein